MVDAVLEHLTADDDPELWRSALNYILAEVEKQPGTLVEIGSCSHWIRPHQARFLPSGYNPTVTGYSFDTQPEFDWSVVMQWTGDRWETTRRQSVKVAVRITIPARTNRHMKATVHSLWMTSREKERRYYGFDRQPDGWKCTATGE